MKNRVIICALVLGILVPNLEEHAGKYQQEQEQKKQQEQQIQEQQVRDQETQLSNEVDNYLAVMLEDYDFTGLDEELAVYFPDLSIHADGIMKMLLDGKVQEVLLLF
ncbi:MAG: hypothetical protein Q4E29_05640, partial [Lachnospiraceae bacterium]|nr:hypothetical protein [Lachnospiraceae bacterium]